MDDAGVRIAYAAEADEDAYHYGAVIQRVAEECCQAEADVYGTDGCVMVTTELDGARVIKTVRFDRHETAEAFRARVTVADPRLSLDD